MRGKTYQREMDCAYNRGLRKVIEDIRFILELPEGKLYTQGVTLMGDNQTVKNSLFLGCETAVNVAHDRAINLESNVFDDCKDRQ